MHFEELLGLETCASDPTDDYAQKVIQAFRKVHENRAALAASEHAPP